MLKVNNDHCPSTLLLNAVHLSVIRGLVIEQMICLSNSIHWLTAGQSSLYFFLNGKKIVCNWVTLKCCRLTIFQEFSYFSSRPIINQRRRWLSPAIVLIIIPLSLLKSVSAPSDLVCVTRLCNGIPPPEEFRPPEKFLRRKNSSTGIIPAAGRIPPLD